MIPQRCVAVKQSPHAKTGELILFALVFSVLVGLVSGYQPANKAVKISALEAIRNE